MKSHSLSVKPRSLEEMARYPTSYEVVARKNGKEYRLTFAERRTRRALLDIITNNADFLLYLMDGKEPGWSYSKARGFEWPEAGVRVCFSGETERTCASREMTS